MTTRFVGTTLVRATDSADAFTSTFRSLTDVGAFAVADANRVLKINALGTGVDLSAVLGTAASANVGVSGHAIPFLDGANSWSGSQAFTGGLTIGGYAPYTTNTLSFGTALKYTGGVLSVDSSQLITPAAFYNRFLVSGSQNTFTLSVTPVSITDFIVTQNGLRLDPSIDYTLSGSTLTITGYIAAGDIIIAERSGAMGPQGPQGPQGSGVTTFLGLTDVAPYSGSTANQILQVNSGGTGLTFGPTLGTSAPLNTAQPGDSLATTVATSAFSQSLVGGGTITTTGGTTTLTAAQASSGLLIISGTLSSNAVVVFGSGSGALFNRPYKIVNNTTGSYTVTLQACATSPGVTMTVAQGKTLSVIVNGAAVLGANSDTSVLLATANTWTAANTFAGLTAATVVANASVAARSATANTGFIQLNPGDANNTGYVGFYAPNAARQGYIGFNATSGAVGLYSDTGAGFIVLNGPFATGVLNVNGAASFASAVTVTGALSVLGNGTSFGPTSSSPGNGGNIRLNDDTGTQRYLVGMLGAVGTTRFSIYDVVNGGERFTLLPSGNVGIGTSTPAAKLDVAGTGNFSGNITAPNLGTSSALNVAAAGDNLGTTIATSAFAQSLVGGSTITTTGGTVTLTVAQASSGLLVISGALTSNSVIVFGTGSAAQFNRPYKIANKTTGSYTLTLQACATSPGSTMTVAQGKTLSIIVNGNSVLGASSDSTVLLSTANTWTGVQTLTTPTFNMGALSYTTSSAIQGYTGSYQFIGQSFTAPDSSTAYPAWDFYPTTPGTNIPFIRLNYNTIATYTDLSSSTLGPMNIQASQVQINSFSYPVVITGGLSVNGSVAFGSSSKVSFASSTSSTAAINFNYGTAPSSPANGDFWTTTTGLFFRLSSGTAQIAITGANTFTGLQTFGAGLTSTTGSFSGAVNVASLIVGSGGNPLKISGDGTNGNYGLGSGSFASITTGQNNFAIGLNALTALTSGGGNSSFGNYSGVSVTTGTSNVFVGQLAGNKVTTGSNNTLVGFGAGQSYTSSEANNTIVGGYQGVAGQSNYVTLSDGAGTARYQWNGTNHVFTGGGITAGPSAFSGSISSTIGGGTVKTVAGGSSATPGLSINSSNRAATLFSGTGYNALVFDSTGSLVIGYDTYANLTAGTSGSPTAVATFNNNGTTSFAGNITAPNLGTSSALNVAAAGDNLSTTVATSAYVQTVNGSTTINSTGGTITLTAAQASVNTLVITGALTSNLVVQFGSGSTAQFNRNYSVVNNTTGSYTVTLQACATNPGLTQPVVQTKTLTVTALNADVIVASSDYTGLVRGNNSWLGIQTYLGGLNVSGPFTAGNLSSSGTVSAISLAATAGTVSSISPDQSTSRLVVNNTGTSGRSYAIISGIANVGQVGCSLYDSTANTTRIVLDDGTGRMGIGTTSPAYTLDVTGTGRFTSGLIAQNITSNGPVAVNSYITATATNAVAVTGTANTNSATNATGLTGTATHNDLSKSSYAIGVQGNVSTTTSSNTSGSTIAGYFVNSSDSLGAQAIGVYASSNKGQPLVVANASGSVFTVAQSGAASFSSTLNVSGQLNTNAIYASGSMNAPNHYVNASAGTFGVSDGSVAIGMYGSSNSTPNIMYFYTGSAVRMTINAAGNVSMGGTLTTGLSSTNNFLLTGGSTFARFQNVVTGIVSGGSGIGVELGNYNSQGLIQSYDRTNNVAAPMTIAASSVDVPIGPFTSQSSVRISSSATSLALTDRNGILLFNNNGGTCTIPANATVAFPVGSRIKVVQWCTGSISITRASGVVMRLYNGSGTPADGDRTLAVGGWLDLVYIGSDNWIIVGSQGLT